MSSYARGKAEKETEKDSHISVRRQQILVVDDNHKNASLLEGYLKPHYDIIKAHSGEECLELVEKEEIDLIILDVVLPGINGYDVCRKIKSNEATKKIPVMLMPALPTGYEKTRSLQVGADDFLNKPFGINEIAARVKALLKISALSSGLERANENLTATVSYTSDMLKGFDPWEFNEKEFCRSFISMVLKKMPYEREKPGHVFLGKKEGDVLKGKIFSYEKEPVDCVISGNFYEHEGRFEKYSNGIVYSNRSEKETPMKYQEHFNSDVRNITGTILNFTAFVSRNIAIIAFNYGRPVNISDAQILKGLTIHIPFFKSVSRQVKETGDAFLHTISVLSKAAESVDESAGNHTFRINKYSTLMAYQLGLPEKFIQDIGISAQMHDVGKIHVHPDILRKPGRLSPEEYESVKQHTIYGARILGEHPRLKMAKTIALTHHECWDGSGYPYGLKGEIIPVEGRILNIVDQYDALRNAKIYKPSYSHGDACNIIIEGDGRTLPSHFDPQVLGAFKEVSGRMEEIYEKSHE